MRVLGIETSCDETAAAVVTSDGFVLSDVVKSQIAVHALYGGVVPEIASRDHARAIVPVIREALERAGTTVAEPSTRSPSPRAPASRARSWSALQRSRKGLAWSTRQPIVGVDHLVGHLLAVFLSRRSVDAPGPAYPFVGLLVSGGHSALYRVDGPSLAEVRELGATRDDAAGEAFDKVAKLLGLGYPGGPIVDRMAEQGDPPRSSRRGVRCGDVIRRASVFPDSKTNASPRWISEHGQPVDERVLSTCARRSAAGRGHAVEKASNTQPAPTCPTRRPGRRGRSQTASFARVRALP